jgi:hypothetical protein
MLIIDALPKMLNKAAGIGRIEMSFSCPSVRLDMEKRGFENGLLD